MNNISISEVIDISNVEVDPAKRRMVEEPVNEDLLAKNKYANNSEYVDEAVYKRILNKMTDGKWSFVPHSSNIKEDSKSKYVEYIGLLIVPGFGVHTGIGSVPINKGNNQYSLSSAKTYAFKNACKEMGLAPNVGNENFDEMLFEYEVEEYIEDKKKETKKPSSKKKGSKSSKKSAKSKKGSISEQISEIRDAYELESDDDFVGFLQIWDEDVIDLNDLEDADYEEFLEYFDKNKSDFEDY